MPVRVLACFLRDPASTLHRLRRTPGGISGLCTLTLESDPPVKKHAYVALIGGALLGAASPVSAQTSGQVSGTIDGKELELPVECRWGNDQTLEIKSHDFMMLRESFDEEPALHASFYNDNYFLVILAGGEHYRMAGRGLAPQEALHHEGPVSQQSGHDGPYDFDLTLECPK